MREAIFVRTARPLPPMDQWHLQALLEPTPSGHRLQLKTMKKLAAYAMMSGGLAVLGFDLFLFILRTLEGKTGFIPPAARIAKRWGVTDVGLGALRIPRWGKGAAAANGGHRRASD